MKAKDEMKVLLNPKFRQDLEQIKKKTRKSVQSLVQEAVARLVEQYRQDDANRRFTKMCSTKARRLGIRTERDVERLIDSIRD